MDMQRYRSRETSPDKTAATELLDYFVTRLFDYGQIQEMRLRPAHTRTKRPVGLTRWVYEGVYRGLCDAGKVCDLREFEGRMALSGFMRALR